MNMHNVTGWERTLSIAAGLAGIGNGVKRGGMGGLLEAGVALLVLKRGLTGHCALKSALCESAALPGRSSRQGLSGEEKVDNALEETFPASDPMSP